MKVHAGRLAEKDVDLAEGSSYYDLLAALHINPETVVVFRDGVPVAFDAPVAGGGTIDVIRVVSGG